MKISPDKDCQLAYCLAHIKERQGKKLGPLEVLYSVIACELCGVALGAEVAHGDLEGSRFVCLTCLVENTK